MGRRDKVIDLHTHILPGLDDGARTIEEAVEMARVAQGDGVTAVMATPHSVDLIPSITPAETTSKLEELRLELAHQSIEVDVLPGLENYIAPDLAKQFEEGRALTLNGSKYLLVELPLQQYPLYTEQVLFELQVKGITPIIAHPERNVVIQKEPSLLYKLVERGMLAQVTAASLVGAFGSKTKKVAEDFLISNLVHIIASDAHSPQGLRSPILSAGVKVAAGLIGEAKAWAMVTTIPQAIIAGEWVEVEPPRSLPSKRLWMFWR